jgi:hypothetical protein
MKKIIIGLLFSLLSLSVFASEIVVSNKDENLSVLDLVISVKSTYSQSSELQAKVVELIAGDGMNPTRMVLIFSTGNPDAENKIFELPTMMYEVKRITFSNIDELVINFTQDTFDQNDNTITIDRSIKINVFRDNEGELTNEIKVTSLK